MHINLFQTSSAAVTFACGFLLAGSADAAIITPTGATSTTTIGSGNRTIDKTIDGSGLTPAGDPGSILDDLHSVNSANTGTYWLSGNNAASSNEVLTFDLGGTFDVDGIHHWVYTRGGEDARGLKTFEIWYLEDGAGDYVLGVDKTALGNFTQPPVQALPAQSKFFATLSDVTHIQLRSIENFSSSEPYLGLSEIRFNAPDAAAIPSPSALITGLVGLGLSTLRRRRG